MFKAITIPFKAITVVISGILLVGCSSMAQLPEGTQYANILQKYGKPTVQCDETPHTLRVWSQQPMGYFAWLGIFNEDEELLGMQQMLSDAMFAQLEANISNSTLYASFSQTDNQMFETIEQEKVSWDQDAVWCHFGPPGRQSKAPYIGKTMPVWSYRYKQNGVWPMMMNIFFNENGQVHALQRSMDPRENDGLFFLGW